MARESSWMKAQRERVKALLDVTERSADMSWRDFERRCEKLVARCFSHDKYRVEAQRETTYSDGRTRRMDIHIAERRQGGKHYVVDCKHFPIATLNENEIQTTLAYKRDSRASKAIILVSASSNCPDRFVSSARRQGVLVHTVSTTNSKLVNKVKDFLFKLDLI